MMRKLLTILTLLLTAITTAWAGEQTITISRNDPGLESVGGVYQISKGGITISMPGGANNPNFLLHSQQKQLNIKSGNFSIKKIVFHCLDNTVSSNLNCFYWGPSTLKQVENTSASVPDALRKPGTLTYNNYDAFWQFTSTAYPNGVPAGIEIKFESSAKPIRYASIDITIEKESGDIYELVRFNSEVKTGVNYLLVGRANATTTKGYALSLYNTADATGGSVTSEDNIVSTEVDLLDQGLHVKANDSVQFIHLTGTNTTSYPWYLRVGESQYIKTLAALVQNGNYNNGHNLQKVSNKTSSQEDYFRTKITVNNETSTINFDHNVSIIYEYDNLARIRHNNDVRHFRNLRSNSSTRQNVYLYKPAEQHEVTTEVRPSASYGQISLRDGILVANGKNWSQQFETVQLLVTPIDGYRIANVTIQSKNSDGEVIGVLSPLSVNPSINGTLYKFEMPGNDAHIIATFEQVQYHNVNMEVKPDPNCGNIFLTEGYVVQQDLVKSYDGQNVVFNVTPNPINPDDENSAYYELYNVTLTDDVTGAVTVLTADAQGNYTFTMPDNSVTITANFKVKHYIGTECSPTDGGHFSDYEGNMTCNGQNTSFYNGAQYYIGDEMTFNVFTEMGYRINKVTIHEVGNATNVTTLTPTETHEYGNSYSFTMPNYNVWITAYFYKTVPDLYLLGEHNGTNWHSYGPKFEYDADKAEWYIDVYYKGTGEYSAAGTPSYGTFSVTRKVLGNVTDGDNWSGINGIWETYDNNGDGCRYRWGATWNSNDDPTLITEESEPYTLQQGGDNGPSAFKIPAGIYRIYVTNDNNKPGQLRVERTDVSLTYDPEGGTADNPAQVSWGTDVTMASNIQELVHNLSTAYATDYPQYVPSDYGEDDVKFDYSIAETTDLSVVKQNGNPTLADPTFTLVDYDIDEEVPVTVKVDGDAWIGWIHAPATAYYQVIKTPLVWIEEHGTPGNNYTVSNELLAVYRANNSLWCKDMMPYKSYAYRTPFSPDYMATFAEQGRVAVGYDGDESIWDQSNWVELDFSNLENGASLATGLQGKKLAAGTVKGTYSKPNHKIVLTSAPDAGDALTYVPNSYCPVNFLASNITGNGPEGANRSHFFFLNPKVQEYAVVTMAVWTGNNTFVVPKKEGSANGNDFNGAFNVDWSLNLWNSDDSEVPQDQSENLDNYNSLHGPQAYKFHAIVRVPESTRASRSGYAGITPKPDQAPDGTYTIYPLDLLVNSFNIITSVSGIETTKAVQSVTYCDLAGRTSSKPFAGVNIVVTRYSDGTIVTSKVVK